MSTCDMRAAIAKPPAGLLPYSACTPAREWVESTKGSPAQLWRRCPRGDWLLWLAAEVGVDRKLVVLAACDCAEATAARRNPGMSTEATERWWQGVDAAAECLRVVRRWCEGLATRDKVRAALFELGCAGGNRVDAVTAVAEIVLFGDGPYDRQQGAEYTSRAAQGDGSADSYTRMATIVRRWIPWSVIEAKLTRGGK